MFSQFGFQYIQRLKYPSRRRLGDNTAVFKTIFSHLD